MIPHLPLDLFILGAGELGKRVGALWRTQFPAAKVWAETATPTRHAALAQLGLIPRCKGEALNGAFPYVLVSLPPSTSENYAEEVGRGGALWDGSGCLLQISSTAVYAEEQGGWIEEDSPLATTERALVLLEAEDRIRERGGTILRLAGLYNAEKGPHFYYQRQESSPLNGQAWINLIHYDDAAALAVAILTKKLRGTFLGCDDSPIKRADLVAPLKPQFRFTGSGGPLGKRCRNPKTRIQTQWKPTKRVHET